MSKWKELTDADFPESIQEVWDGDIEGSKWLDDILTEGDDLQELEKKHYEYAIDANKRLGECRQKLINLHNGISKLLEYNYMNLCRADVEALLEDNSLNGTKIEE